MNTMNKTIALLLSVVMTITMMPLTAFASESSKADAGEKASDLHTAYIKAERNYDLAYEMLELINEERLKEGSVPLKMNKTLLDAAMIRAGELVVFYSHTRPNNTEFNTAASGALILENIAIGYPTPEDCMDGFMNSAGHSGTLLYEDFRSVGIGVVFHNGLYYWVQDFGFQTISENCSKPANDTIIQKIDYLTNVMDNKVYPYQLMPVVYLADLRTYESGNEICIGQTMPARMAIYNSRGGVFAILENLNVSWEYSGDCIKIDSKQNLTALKAGRTTVIATYEGKTYSKEMSVVNHALRYQYIGNNSHRGNCDNCYNTVITSEPCIFDNGIIVQQPTEDYPGRIKYTCKTCGNSYTDNYEPDTSAEKFFVQSAKLSASQFTYDGKQKTPTAVVKDNYGNKLAARKDYEVSYGSTTRKAIGRYSVKLTYKGKYSGSKTLYFTIGPKNPSSISTNLYGYDDVKVSWKKVSGATGYKVYYKKSTSATWSSKSTTGTSVKIANLTDGVKYNIKVVTYKTKNGYKCYNAGKSASVYTLKKVAGVKATKSSTKVKVSWTNISGETGYQISQSTKKSGTNIVATYKTTSGKSKTVTAKKGKTYYYKVRAYKIVGNKTVYGPWSAAVRFVRK